MWIASGNGEEKMKKVLCILILLLFNAFLCFSYEIDYVESFQLSKINFSQKINILSEKITKIIISHLRKL